MYVVGTFESVTTAQGPRHRTICSLGSLAPAPAEEWRSLAHKLSAALGGQTTLVPDPAVVAVAERARPTRGRRPLVPRGGEDVVAIHTDQVRVEDVREAGPVHVGHQLWHTLRLDTILAEAGLSARARRLTEVMTLNRLVSPASEHAMPDWIRRTALADILGTDVRTLSDEALYRNLDRLHPQRAAIEQALAARAGDVRSLTEGLRYGDPEHRQRFEQAGLRERARIHRLEAAGFRQRRQVFLAAVNEPGRSVPGGPPRARAWPARATCFAEMLQGGRRPFEFAT